MKPDIYKLKIYTLPLFILVSTGLLFCFCFGCLLSFIYSARCYIVYMVLVKGILGSYHLGKYFSCSLTIGALKSASTFKN